MIYAISKGCQKPFAYSSSDEVTKSPSRDGDMILMLPIDIRKHDALRERFEEGRFVSFFTEDGYVKIASDYDPAGLYNSVMRVKRLDIKPFADVSGDEVKMIERNCPGFSKRLDSNEIAIHPLQTVSLIRVNPEEAIHFIHGASSDTPHQRPRVH